MKYIILILPLFFIGLYAQKIPANRLVDWTNAGAHELPQYDYIIAASSLGLDNSGKSDNSTILNNAIDSAKKPVLFLFEPGVYLFNNTIRLQSNVCISGYSSESTFFKFDMNKRAVSCISANGSANPIFYDVSAGYFRGSNYLVSDHSELFHQKDYIELRQDNGNWDIKPADWAKHSVGQILQISHIADDTLFFYEKLRINYAKELNPAVRLIKPINNCEIRFLNLERLDEPETGAGYNVSFSIAVNCLLAGVESNKSVGSHVMLSLSKNITVKGSYFHHAFTYDGNGTRGYGVTINNHASDCLVENNIFKFLRHSMMVKHGANGNVFAYNYSREPNRSEPISNLSGDISLHGHFAFANLFEGNIVQNIFIDAYWGPSGPLNTFLRNRAELYGIVSTSSGSDTMNFIGNETTNSDMLMGQFQLQGAGHYLYGNNILGTIEPADSNELVLKSLFYRNVPAFWDIVDEFPSIGLPNDLGKNTIPAKYRYMNIAKKTVGEYRPLSVANNCHFVYSIYPNPATDYIEISLDNHTMKGEVENVKIYDVLGIKHPVSFAATPLSEGNLRLDVSNLPAGVYFVRVGGQVLKFVKL